MDRLLRPKRKGSWLLLLVCCVLFNGCDPAFNRKPFNYPNTKWTCEDLNVWFIVDPAYTRIYYGQMEIDGSMCELGFFYGTSAIGGINTFKSIANGETNTDEAFDNRL